MKKVTFDKLKLLCPDINDIHIKDHLKRLNEDYYTYFTANEICDHLKAVACLTIDKNVEVICMPDSQVEKKITCTIIAYDYPAVFSLITGILASLGFRIISGKSFTYSKVGGKISSRDLKVRRDTKALRNSIKKRVIIDSFNGFLADSYSHIWLRDLRSLLIEVFLLLEKGDAESIKLAKEKVNEQVALRLLDIKETHTIFYPVTIEIDNSNQSYTGLKVLSEDTPFFLYTLSTALSMQNILIEYVNIKTIKNQVIDEFNIVDSNGNKIDIEEKLDKIKFSVLLTKQFTYFIGNAPDPYIALSRFELLTHDIMSLPEKGNWMEILLDPHLMKDLARLLGASDFIWEDFIRLQYETILPLLKSGEGGKILESIDSIPDRLNTALKNAKSRKEQSIILNDFKDREIFHIDLYHILNPDKDIRSLSKHLTALAENIINKTADLSYQYLAETYGYPTTVAGLKAQYSILGLGKFGGAALGYASDIELLFVYSDHGSTNGKKSIENSEFFELLVKEVIGFIKAKKEGIFDLDLRLRPYGGKSPLACSLDTFCKYYGAGGEAYSYERLALVRMRPIGGDMEFGNQLERIRNEFIYFTKSIDIKELYELRGKQLTEKTDTGHINAKFSQGALVDIEYTVQILQVMYGKDYPPLRTSKIHNALNALAELGILNRDESEQIIGAYGFFRKLINGLRMLRGSAKDLFLPAIESMEYAHLARRMGYQDEGDLTAAKKLHIEFDTRSAMVRAFIEHHFGKDMLPGEKSGNIADLIISEDLPDSLKNKILHEYGFKNPERAFINLKKLSGEGDIKKIFISIAILVMDILTHKSDPDMALNNWERFIRVIPEASEHYKEMLSQPVKLDILLNIFSTSQFLSDTLIKNPDFLEWVISPHNLYKSLNRREIENELQDLYTISNTHTDWLNKIRQVKKREILRIGTRDVCLGMPLTDIVQDLSILAESFIEVVSVKNANLLKEEDQIKNSEEILQNYTVLAFGKLGGNELNYSSDIDLMLIYSDHLDKDNNETKIIYSRILEGVLSDLSSHIEEGYAYRVDLRLRPYGNSGSLAYSIKEAVDYYSNIASLWEIQALLKLRPVAGNLEIGKDFINNLYDIFIKRLAGVNIRESIEKLRDTAVKEKSKSVLAGIDVKNGVGGIRDIEFLVQGLQLLNLPSHPELLEGNTIQALMILKQLHILDPEITEELKNDYSFMRCLEHYLQLYEDRQVHSLPKDPAQLEAVAKRILGINITTKQFIDQVHKYQDRIRGAYNKYFIGILV